jgi:two-component system sensor histidine kinase SenX3
LRIAAPAAQEFRVTLAFEPPPAEQQFIARADPLALQQALLNLLDNAIKHSPPQTTVSILLAKSSSEFQITIRDHGPGIPPSEHQRIFERFYRLGSELRRETQGVGIGLSIVKHIIESHSGKVLVQSEPPHGADFTLTLPIP